MDAGNRKPSIRFYLNGAVNAYLAHRTVSMFVDDTRGTDKMETAELTLDNHDQIFSSGGVAALTYEDDLNVQIMMDTGGSFVQVFRGMIVNMEPTTTTLKIELNGYAHYAARIPLECWQAIKTSKTIYQYLCGTPVGNYASSTGILYGTYCISASKALNISTVNSAHARITTTFDIIQLEKGMSWWEAIGEMAKAMDFSQRITLESGEYYLNLQPKWIGDDSSVCTTPTTLFATYSAAKAITHSIKRGADRPDPVTVGTFGRDYIDAGFKQKSNEVIDMVEVFGAFDKAIYGHALGSGITRATAQYRKVIHDQSIETDEQAIQLAESLISHWGAVIEGGTITLTGTTDIMPLDAVRIYDSTTIPSTNPTPYVSYAVVAAVATHWDDKGYKTVLTLAEMGATTAESHRDWILSTRRLNTFVRDPDATVECMYGMTPETILLTENQYAVIYDGDGFFVVGAPGPGHQADCSWNASDDLPSTDLMDAEFQEYMIGYEFSPGLPSPVYNSPYDFTDQWTSVQDPALLNIATEETHIPLPDGFGRDYQLFTRVLVGGTSIWIASNKMINISC